jgi:hypothetical protein
MIYVHGPQIQAVRCGPGSSLKHDLEEAPSIANTLEIKSQPQVRQPCLLQRVTRPGPAKSVATRRGRGENGERREAAQAIRARTVAAESVPDGVEQSDLEAADRRWSTSQAISAGTQPRPRAHAAFS